MQGYHLIDSGDFEKLEQVGPFVLKRPAAAAVWPKSMPAKVWQDFDAEFVRKRDGKGNWLVRNPKLKNLNSFPIQVENLKLVVRLTDFGHLGFFAEHFGFWRRFTKSIARIQEAGQECRILNLFAYTGGASLVCANAGAQVVHLDSSKSSVAWAKENAILSGISEQNIRWIVEDAKKFVAREGRRQSRYHGVILDPPSYGKGNKSEVWKIETDLAPLLTQIRELLHPGFGFVLLSSHSPGYTPLALKNLLNACMPNKGSEPKFIAEELVIPHQNSHLVLPSGAGCFLDNFG